MRSPSRIVGFIEPVGTSFQSASDERKEKTMRAKIPTGLIHSLHTRRTITFISLGWSSTRNVQYLSAPSQRARRATGLRDLISQMRQIGHKLNPSVRNKLKEFDYHQHNGHLAVWTAGSRIPDFLAERIIAVASPEHPTVTVLKQGRRRSVYRVEIPQPKYQSWIVKGYPLGSLRDRLRYRKYGLREFMNYQKVRRYELPAPACRAYFEIRSLGLVRANGVVLEDLQDWQTLQELIDHNPPAQGRYLSYAIKIIIQLYHAGVNHIDVSPQNLMVSSHDHSLKLIDWHYCRFFSAPNPAQLIYQAAHFLCFAHLKDHEPTAQLWIEELHELCPVTRTLANFQRSVALLLARPKLTAPDRLDLIVDAELHQAMTRS